MAGAVRVHGLRELTRAFKAVSKDLDRKLVGELQKAAEPVRARAEQLALTQIRNMPATPEWATMKVGVSRAQGLVYMVPASRGRGGQGRPNFAHLLMTRAMDPALQSNQQQVINRIDDLIGDIADRNGF